MPAFKPDPLSAVNVGKRVANGAEAGRQVTRELLRRKRGAGVNRAVIRPGVEIIEQANVVDIHSNGSCSIWIAPRGGSLSVSAAGSRLMFSELGRGVIGFRVGRKVSAADIVAI